MKAIVMFAAGALTIRIRLLGALWLCTLVLVLTACGDESLTGGEQAGTGLPPNTIGPNGGTIDFAGGNVTLVFPAGAVSQNVTITVQATGTFPPPPTVVSGTAYDFGPQGTRFAQPVELTIKYDPAKVPSGVRESELGLYKVVGTAWQEVAGNTVNPTNNTLTGPMRGFSVYGILGVPVASVTVTPDNTTIVVRRTVQLTATRLDAEGNALTGRTVMWFSSDEAVATVDAMGLVTAVAAGSATITATTEGKSGTAVITVLEPVAAVTVMPDSASIVPGETVQLTATLRDSAGNELTGREVTWSSSDEAVATVDATGLVTGRGSGSARITATSEGQSGTAAITIPVSVLIDASRDGGVWWFPQGPTFNPNEPHQGKAFADHLRSRGFHVRELPRPFTIALALLKGYDLVIRANEFGSYLDSELVAYEQYVSEGGNLLLLQDFVRPTETDVLGAVFGLRFAGITRGTQLVNFLPDPITEGVASGQLRYGVGSGLIEFPPGAKILGHLDASSYLDLNDNGVRDENEPTAPRVMGRLEFRQGLVVFIGDTNFLQSVPQPLTDNILRAFP